MLASLADELGRPAADPDHVELTLAVRAARLVVAAARRRPESRGGHVLEEFPDRSAAWDGVHVDQLPPGAPAAGRPADQPTTTPNSDPMP